LSAENKQSSDVARLSTPENEARIAEFEKMAADDQAKRAVVVAASAKLFDPKALAESTRKIQVLIDPDLGEIRYGLLSKSELAALNVQSIVDDTERAEHVVFAMLRKADSSYTWDDYEAMPFDLRNALTLLLSQVFSRFLRVQRRIGSQVAPPLKLQG
jgi:hypothetical protein